MGWFIGNRSAETFEKFYEKMKPLNAVFYSDDWRGYKKVLPKKFLKTGKKYTVAIEQNNANIRHFLARMGRRTKVVSRSEEMVDLSLRLCWNINENDKFQEYQKIFLSIFR